MAQWSGGNDKQKKDDYPFSATGGVGCVFSANETNISASLPAPSLSFEVGGYPIDKLYFAARMRALMPYSTGLKSTTSVQDDSTHSHEQTSWDKASTLYFVVGFLQGKNKRIMGGVNSGFGIAFIEQGNALTTTFAWDMTLELGVNFNKRFGLLASATYSYAGMTARGFATDGFGVVTELKAVVNF